MKSGATSFEQAVTLFNNPALLQTFRLLIARPGGIGLPPTCVPGAPTVPMLFDTKLTCGDSTEKPNHHVLSQSSTKRSCSCRAQLKPTTYCASIVTGVFSVCGSIPTLFWVNRLHA